MIIIDWNKQRFKNIFKDGNQLLKNIDNKKYNIKL
jgi:hypothetical protein